MDSHGYNHQGPDSPPPRRGRGPIYVGAAAIIVWLAVMAYLGPWLTGPPKLPPAPLAAPTRPLATDYRWALTSLDGRPFDFPNMRGKAVFVNLWASWCPPCRAEMPSILALAKDPRLKDVEFLLVGVDDPPERLSGYLNGLGSTPGSNLHALVAHEGHPTFESEGIPATFLLDGNGEVVVAHTGGAKWDTPKMVDFLERLAKQAKASTRETIQD
jgi:thiol-disulfide isomerase/thioredoxin